MSRAFIKETDDVQEIVLDRPISSHPNFVTPQGLALIERSLSAASAEYDAAQSRGDRAAIARTAREWRYWTSRRGSAPPSSFKPRQSQGGGDDVPKADRRRDRPKQAPGRIAAVAFLQRNAPRRDASPRAMGLNGQAKGFTR